MNNDFLQIEFDFRIFLMPPDVPPNSVLPFVRVRKAQGPWDSAWNTNSDIGESVLIPGALASDAWGYSQADGGVIR